MCRPVIYLVIKLFELKEKADDIFGMVVKFFPN